MDTTGGTGGMVSNLEQPLPWPSPWAGGPEVHPVVTPPRRGAFRTWRGVAGWLGALIAAELGRA